MSGTPADTDLPPAVRRRLERLEGQLGALTRSVDLLSQALARRGLVQDAPIAPHARHEEMLEPAVGSKAPLAEGGGLAGAAARGEAVRVAWVRNGDLVPTERLAEAWGLTRQAVGAAAGRGELFALKVGNRLYVPRQLLELKRETVSRVCSALGALSAEEKFVFWTRPHGALGGKPIVEALSAGKTVERITRLAHAWAHERGAAVDAAAA